jgi:hypothetical protein
MTVTNKRLVEILTTAMEKPEIANALIQRVINTLDKQEREWQGLTEDEVAQAMFRADAIVTGPMQFKFAKEIEAKLKEKNT